MTIEWKSLLAENAIPQHQWPLEVEERQSGADDKLAVVVFPSETPIAVRNPQTGRNEWNPELRQSLELIYRAYRGVWGKLSAPAWSRAGNSVRFHPV